MSRTYITIQGDMWDGIAKKLYGTEQAMNILLKANLPHNNTVIFDSGVVVNVPEYTPQKTDFLPPWRL